MCGRTDVPQIRPFAERLDYERMIDYFLTADDAFLEGMGVDRKKLPRREAWIESAMLDHKRINAEKERAYLAWIYKGPLIGHSSINGIKIGEEAFIHLHLWDSRLRKTGLGTKYFKASAAEFMRVFRLKRLYCEPYAENPAPNHVLVRSGFRFVKRYRRAPGAINYEQDVNQYVLESSADNVRGQRYIAEGAMERS
jgi:[ribosomal protein S5]-alanine N-acetyltransferase